MQSPPSLGKPYQESSAYSEEWLGKTSHNIPGGEGSNVTILENLTVRRKSLEKISVGCMQGQAYLDTLSAVSAIA